MSHAQVKENRRSRGAYPSPSDVTERAQGEIWQHFVHVRVSAQLATRKVLFPIHEMVFW